MHGSLVNLNQFPFLGGKFFEKLQTIKVAEHQNFDPTQINSQCRAVFLNGPDPDLMQHIKTQRPEVEVVLVTDLPMHEYQSLLQGQMDQLTDHVLAQSCELTPAIAEQIVLRNPETTRSLESALLGTSAIRKQVDIVDSDDRLERLDSLFQFLLGHKQVHDSQAKHIRAISDELLSNAFFDAPVASGMREPHDHGKQITLEEGQAVHLRVAFNNDFYIVSASDPFGSFSKQKFFEYSQKVLKHHQKEDLLDNKIGGAGLGLLRMLFYSQALVVSVTPQKKTEVLCLSYLNQPMAGFDKRPRSFSYLVQN